MGKRKAKRLRLQQKRASALRAEQNRRTDEIPEVLSEEAFSDSDEASVKNEEQRKTTGWAWEAPRDERPLAREIPSFLQQEEPADGEEVASVRAQAQASEPEPVLRMPPSRPRLDAWPKRRGHIHVVVTAGLLPDEVKTLKQILQVNWEADEAQASETASVRRDLMASFHRTPDYWVLPPGHTLQDRREEGVQCWIACEDPEELFEAHLGRFAEHPDVDKIRFLLFYQNAAHYIGAKLTEDTAPEQAAQQWLERCQTLLDFQARYPEETLLLDSTQALQNPFDLRDAAYRLNLPIDTQRGRSKTERQPEQALAVALAADWIQQHPAIAQMTGLLSAQAESVRGQLQLVPSNQAIQAYRGLKSQIRQALQEKTKLQSDLDAQSKKNLEEKGGLNQQIQAEQAKAAELNKTLAEEKKRLDVLNQQKTDLEKTHTEKLKEAEEENELLLLQLHQVQEELERYYLENQEYKQKHPPLYGAVERIKQSLEYRIGKALIDHSRSLKGLITLRKAIKTIRTEVQREDAERGDQQLPTIADYLDAHEAERVKNHLSYRLGTSWVKSKGSPVRWLKLPFLLKRDRKDFAKSMSNKIA